MRKSTVKLVIWSVIAVTILAIMLVLFVRPTIFSNVSFYFPSFSVVRYDNADKYTVGGGTTGTVNSLDISWLDGSVRIESYEGSNVKIDESYDGELADKYKIRWYNDNGTLRVKYLKSGVFSRSCNKMLTIYIPEGTKLDTVKIDAVSSDMNIKKLDAYSLELEGVSGNCNIAGINGTKLSHESVSGSLDCSESVFTEISSETFSGTVKLSGVTTKSFEAETMSGDIDCDSFSSDKNDAETVSGKIALNFVNECKPSHINAETVSGNVTVTLDKSAGFTASISSVSGDMSCDFKTVNESNKKIVCGDGSIRIEVSTVSGNLRITENK